MSKQRALVSLGLATACVVLGCASRHPSAGTSGSAVPGRVYPLASSPSSIAPARAPLFGDGVGLHVKFADGQPESELSTLVELGVHWVRDSVGWRVMEPAPGAFRAFPPDFARRLAFYREHDIGVVYTLAFANATAYPATPADPLRSIDAAAFGRYAAKAARLLQESGVRFVLEIWNEPHGFTIRELAGGAFNGAPPSPWVAHYVRMVREATRQVKAVDAAIPVLDDDDMWVLHYRFIEAGLPSNLDGFAFHPYTRHQPAGAPLTWFPPEHTAVASDTPWTRPFVVVDDDASFESAVRRLREAGAKALATPPEMWITEWGWKLGDPGAHGTITEDTVAAYLPRAYVLAAGAGVRALCWFSSEDRNDGPWGLSTDDGRKRKAYGAMRAMSRLLGKSSFVRRLTGEAHRTTGPQAYLFCEAGATCTAVAWMADDRDARMRLSGALPSSAVIDVMGGPVATESGPDGARTAAVGAAPIYLTGIPADAALSPGFAAAVSASFE
jgi:hypothetical protein